MEYARGKWSMVVVVGMGEAPNANQADLALEAIS
jgi:hypothetical protein